jgi:ATP-dependent DNA helicase RecQ
MQPDRKKPRKSFIPGDIYYMENKEQTDDETAVCDDPAVIAARNSFGISYLYPWQRLVIANILDASGYSPAEKEEDTAYRGRQIVLLPTGAGKSLCFLIPALLLNGPTLVIYPLLALMADQQRRMDDGGIMSVTFRGNQTAEEREENFRRIRNGAKVILANPEVLQNENLVNRLSECGIAHAAVDEAHCVSEWGDSFRPAYLTLGPILEKLRVPVITAFTATASPEVLNRVAEVLFSGEAHIVRSESDRPNIHYEVRTAYSKKQEALRIAAEEKRPMLIFCGTRANAEDMARELNACFGSGTARFYHAGLEKAEKEETEKWFFERTDAVLAVTCAYGMGIDKKDIHTVCHIATPKTAEEYIQEAGRSGRDGTPARAILLTSYGDRLASAQYARGSREYAMKRFAETDTCRRQVLLDALGAEQAVCSGCDLCDARNGVQQKKHTSDSQTAYEFIRHHRKMYSAEELPAILLELYNREQRRVLGVNTWGHSDVAEVTGQLEAEGRIRVCRFPWKGKIDIVKEAGSIFLQQVSPAPLQQASTERRQAFSLRSRLMKIQCRRMLLPHSRRMQQEQEPASVSACASASEASSYNEQQTRRNPS